MRHENDGERISFLLYAVRGIAPATQSAVAVIDNGALTDGACNFEFTDSFGNSGKGKLVFSENGLILNYSDITFEGNFGVTEMGGVYTRTGDVPGNLDAYYEWAD